MMIIYKITNIVNNKLYIGQTSYPLYHRFNGHCTDSRRNNTKISRAIRKYGKSNFKIEALVEGDFNRALTDELEKHYIQLYNTINVGYNISAGGNCTVMSEETKKKISEKNKGKKLPKPKNYKDIDRYDADRLKEIKENRSISHRGGKNIKARICFNPLTGIFYDTITEAAESIGISFGALKIRIEKGKTHIIKI